MTSSLIKKILTVFGIFFFALPVFAYSSPNSPEGFINDFANMIGATAKQALEQKLVQFEKDTSNEISIVTINSLAGDTIENFAVKLFEEWKIGTAKNDNGVLLLISIDDRKMRIEVGYGLESALSSSTADQIISHEVSPAFSQGDYRQGVDNGVAAIIKALNGQYQVEEKIVDDHGKWVYLIVVLVVVFSIILISVVSGRLGQRKISRRKFRK